jgi:outer membrane protein assembly factor BamB
MKPTSFVLPLLLGLAATVPGHAAAASPAEPASLSDRPVHGLVVQVGATDAKLATRWASSGKTIVHVLTSETAVNGIRRDLAAAGLYGLAAAEPWRGGDLPYGDNLVNLLVADLEGLGPRSPSLQEIARVLAPGGTSCLHTGGAWKSSTKAFPAETDEWRCYYHDASGNPVSRDRLVGPATTLRWIAGYGGFGGSTEGPTGFRLADGLAFDHTPWVRNDPQLVTRDAFNGIPLWRRPSSHVASRADMVVRDGKLFMLLEEKRKAHYCAVDAKTGDLLKVFDQVEFNLTSGKQMRAVHAGGLIVLANGTETLTALDEKTGEVRWTYRDPLRLFFPVLDAAAKRLFVVAARPKPGYEVEHWSRWPGVVADAVVAIDLASGSRLWRSTAVAGRHIGQTLVDRDRLVVFAPVGIGAPHWPEKRDSSYLACLALDDGRLLWQRAYVGEDKQPNFTFVLFARDDKYYLLGNNHAIVYDREGKHVELIWPQTVNNRCPRPSVTPNYLIIGFGLFWGQDRRWTFQNVARSDCATAAVPGYGMLYYHPGNCHCFLRINGQLAVASTAVPPDVEDDRRLDRLAGPPGTIIRSPAAPPEFVLAKGDKRDPNSVARKPRSTDNLLRDEWWNNDALPDWSTKPVASGDVEYTAVCHEHRLEARRRGELLWTFVAGARISSPPVVTNGLVHFGSHDGYVYCLDAAGGALRWRFLAAAADRRLVAYGQLESVSPVYGVVLHEGKVCAAAGRHPELDGGIHLWGIVPSTGAVAWQGTVAYPIEWQMETKRTRLAGSQNRILGTALRVENGTLCLGYVTIDPANPPRPPLPRFKYVPTERWKDGRPGPIGEGTGK